MAENEVKYEVLPAKDRAEMLSREDSIFFNVAKFEQAQRIAQMFASSTMVPEMFRNNIGNCMIGLNYAARIGADPFMVLQTMYIVHGRPGVEAKLIEAVINQSAKYSEPLQYEWLGEDDEPTTRQAVLKGVKDDQGCQAFTIDRKSGKRVIGPKITWALVKAEGWYDKPGPDKTIKTNKWRTMPEMMFYYRAASWFANKNCPELKLGMMTKEEIEDLTIDVTPSAPGLVQGTEEKPGAKVYEFKPNEVLKAAGYKEVEVKKEGQDELSPAPGDKNAATTPTGSQESEMKPPAREKKHKEKAAPALFQDTKAEVQPTSDVETEQFVAKAEEKVANLTDHARALILRLYGMKDGTPTELKRQFREINPESRQGFLDRCAKQETLDNGKVKV